MIKNILVNKTPDKVKLLGKSGLTLIELIITLAIISIMILIVAEVYVGGIAQSKTDMKKARLQVEGKSALEGITRNIKLASSVEATHATYTSDNTNLILKVPAIDSSENFIYSGETRLNDYITYYLDGKNLHRIINSSNITSRFYSQDGIDDTLLTNVKSLSFTYDPAVPNTTLVMIDITLEDTTPKVPIDINLKANGRLRNVQSN